MSIKLTRVELSNIRSHEHIVFLPEESGITALRGSNGTGKSTIVDSIAWALYGTKPTGVSKTSAIYRNGAKWGKDKCYAIVELEVDGYKLKVERRMIAKNGAVECDVWEIETDEHGDETERHVAGTAVSQVESYLRQRTKMDEKGFLAAVLVQQKQVDNLIVSSPKERAQVIEKLTGISSITAALNSARSESNSLKKIAANSSADEKGLKATKKEHTKLQTEFTKKEKEVEKLKKLTTKTTADFEALRKESENAETTVALEETTRQAIIELTAKIESQEESLESLIAEKDLKKNSMSRLESSTNIEEISDKLSELKKTLRKHELDLSRNKDALDENATTLAKNQKILEKSTIKDKLSAKKGLNKSLSQIEALNDKIRQDSDSIVASNADAKKIEQAIGIITQENGNCPTCLQHVDNVSLAVQTLTEQRDNILSKNEAVSNTVKSNKARKLKVENTVEKYDILINALDLIEKSQQERESLELKTPVYMASITSITAEVDAHEKLYNAAKHSAETKSEYDRLLKRAIDLSDAIEQMKSQKRDAENKLKKSGSVSPTALASLRKKLDKANADYSKHSNDFVRAEGELSLLTEQLRHMKIDIERGEKDLEAHRKLLLSVETATNTTKVIEDFREDRVRNSIPVIEMYASDLFNRFTEGRFTRLKLDAKFNASVSLANGDDRAVGLLSGGELSAAAMALRIAISMLLNGGSSTNLIILDEVLVSQDVNRAEVILSTIKEVCKGQVIIIAHNEAVDAISDSVVQLGVADTLVQLGTSDRT